MPGWGANCYGVAMYSPIISPAGSAAQFSSLASPRLLFTVKLFFSIASAARVGYSLMHREKRWVNV